MICLLALLLAAALPPAVQPGKPSVALLPLRALGVPADVQAALQETLRNELAALPEAALVPEAALAAELAAEPDCQARVACAAAAARKAGARTVILGTASQLGDAFLIDLKLVDTRTAQELRRATHPLTGSRDGLIETLRAAAVELLAPARYAGSLRIEVAGGAGAEIFVDGRPVGKAPLPAPVGALSPGKHTVRIAGARDQSTFVEVAFGKLSNVRIEAPRPAAPAPLAAALPSAVLQPAPRAGWVRPAAYAGLGLGLAAAIVGVTYHARAYATASDLNRREQQNQLGGAGRGRRRPAALGPAHRAPVVRAPRRPLRADAVVLVQGSERPIQRA
jgi:hypothetical protein